MKNYAYLLLVGAVLSMNAPALAETRAVNISIGSIGGPLDDAALRTVRVVIGHAVASSTVDTFVVYGSQAGASIPIEGGLSACAQAGSGTTKSSFSDFIRELRSIRPRAGTFYNLERSASCPSEENVFCTEDAKICPDGSAVGRIPPSCEFAPCPGE